MGIKVEESEDQLLSLEGQKREDMVKYISHLSLCCNVLLESIISSNHVLLLMHSILDITLILALSFQVLCLSGPVPHLCLILPTRIITMQIRRVWPGIRG